MDSWDDVAATSEIAFSDQCGSIFQLSKAIFLPSIFFFFFFLVAASFLFNELCWLKINAKCALFGAKWELYSGRKPLSNSEELLQRDWDEISTYVILEKGVRTVKNTFWLKWYRPGFWAFQEEIV